jgi:hypothetical protein
MVQVIFTQQLARFTQLPEVECAATTLREALETAFAANPQLRGYVLDEQGHLRKHVAVFIDGVRVRDRTGLSDTLGAARQIHVLQALSGG